MQVRIRTFWNTARTLARPVGLAAALLLAAALGPAAMAATGAKNFDHLTTGFPLTGQHESARCEDCHVRGIFKGTPAQCAACHTQGALVTAVMIPNNHFPTSEPCSTCHTTATFYGAHFAHSAVAPGTCSQCHNGVFAKGKTTNHLATTSSCDVCHTTASFTAAYVALPAGHIPTAQACAVCHDPANFVPARGYPTGMVHTGITTGCETCHAAAAAPQLFKLIGTYINPQGQSVKITANGLDVDVYPKPEGPGHIPTQRSCELCHAGGYQPLPPQNFTTFVMNHDGITSGCAACHSDGMSFTGLTTLTQGPRTSTSLITMSSLGKHIPLPAGDDCSTCHTSVTAFGPGTVMNHAGITSNCNQCHEASGTSYYNLSNLAVRPSAAVDPLHPSVGDGDCSTCHRAAFNKGAFNIPSALPAVGHGPSVAHMPNPGGQSCVTCHTTVNEGLAASAVYTAYGKYQMGPAGHSGISSNCQACHERDVGIFLNISQATGSRPLAMVVRPNASAIGITTADSNHPAKTQTNPSGADCITCHTASAFAIGGFANVTIKPNNHIAVTGVSCNTCHTTGSYAAVVLPMPHQGAVAGSCTSCHNGQTFAGSVFTPNALGTAGGTFDGSTGVNFVATQITSKISAGISTSGGHVSIPTADDCSTCHLVTTAFGPNTAMVHTNISTGCKSCHEGGDAFAGITNLVARPTTAVDSVHPQSSDTKDCSSCHSLVFTSGAFNIPTVLPAAGDGPSISHMPNPAGTACVTCHTGVSAGVSAATAATAYTVYVMGPSGHTGITSSCQTCHENPSAFLNITSTATLMVRPPQTGGTVGITPADANHPLKTQTTPTNGTDCATCHTGTGFVAGGFSTGVTKPANHINISTGAACNSCHTVNTTSVVLPMPHTAVVGTCASCHNAPNTLYAGSVFTPTPGSTSTPASGGTFDGSVGTNFKARQIVQSPAVGASGGHIPLPSGDDCNVCHLSTSAFTGTAMVHTGISSGCASCHAAGSKWYGETYTASPLVTKGNVTLSPLHVPFAGAACEKCHSASVFTSFGTATTVPHTSGVFMTYSGTGNSGNPNRSLTSTPKCITCHAPSGTKWYLGTGQSMSSATMGNHHNSQSGDDCEYCHSTGGFGGAAAAAAVAHRPMLHVAAGPAMRPGGLGLPGAIGGGAASMPFTHVGVAPGNCGVSCHTPGGSATPKPANHLPTLLSCDTCHRTSSWLPALFAHNNVASGSCGTCHAGNWATAKPAKHLLTNRTCDSCHHSTTTWMPVTYSHLDMIYSPHPANVACSACHVTNTEQVVWKYPNLKPGCGGCHGSQFATQSVRRAHGPGPVRPGAH